MNASAKFDSLMKMHQDLLECYSQIAPLQYKVMTPAEQKDFCFGPRTRLEQSIVNGKFTINDFFDAAKQ